MVAQAELWLMETPNQKRRPVLVVSRNEVIPVLNNIVVAPVTSTMRDIPTCIPLGPEEGIDHDSVATFDNLAAVPKSVLTRRLGALGIDGAATDLRGPRRDGRLLTRRVAGVAEIGSSLRTSSATVELGRLLSCREAIPMEFIIYPELPATDINRAAAWYRERLGLEPVLHGNEPIEPGTTEFEYDLLYDTGTAKFGVYESFAAGRSEATAARIVVTDFDAAHAELVSNGVVFEDYDFGDDFRTVDGVLVSEDGEKTAWFKDSEGNILAIGSSY